MDEFGYEPDELLLQLPDNEEFLMTRYNSKLYTFIGNLSTRNHVFLITEVDEGSLHGHAIFAHSKSFDPIVSFMVECDYPMDLNATEISEGDELMFQASLEKYDGSGLEDYIPDEFFE